MKKFNQEITVTISVDDIATKLVASFAEGFAHKEMVAEAIIGSLLPTNYGMNNLYNTLNGYTLDVDFAVGQEVGCSTKTYEHVFTGEGSEIKQKHTEIGLCTVIEIDVYRPNKLKVEWNSMDSQGNGKIKTEWVHHTTCSGIQNFLSEEMA